MVNHASCARQHWTQITTYDQTEGTCVHSRFVCVIRDSEDQLEVAQDRNKGSMQKKCYRHKGVHKQYSQSQMEQQNCLEEIMEFENPLQGGINL